MGDPNTETKHAHVHTHACSRFCLTHHMNHSVSNMGQKDTVRSCQSPGDWTAVRGQASRPRGSPCWEWKGWKRRSSFLGPWEWREETTSLSMHLPSHPNPKPNPSPAGSVRTYKGHLYDFDVSRWAQEHASLCTSCCWSLLPAENLIQQLLIWLKEPTPSSWMEARTHCKTSPISRPSS